MITTTIAFSQAEQDIHNLVALWTLTAFQRKEEGLGYSFFTLFCQVSISYYYLSCSKYNDYSSFELFSLFFQSSTLAKQNMGHHPKHCSITLQVMLTTLKWVPFWKLWWGELTAQVHKQHHDCVNFKFKASACLHASLQFLLEPHLF